MHRSSENISAIATALAKAQVELSNPEKSMVGHIDHVNRGNNPQTFRYAPLSSGLEIIRKTLGGQQIAVAQTTVMENGTVSLTTLLMHTSGEWISSDWPVCQISDISSPRRMGAALTYARRYALFTLVGIAGDDDLDATPATSWSNETSGQQSSSAQEAQQTAISDDVNRSVEIKTKSKTCVVPLYERLTSEITSAETLVVLQKRASSILKSKNSLSAEDARKIEALFADCLRKLQPTEPELHASHNEEQELAQSQPLQFSENHSHSSHDARPKKRSKRRVKKGSELQPRQSNLPDVEKIDKSALAIGEPRRHRDKNHLNFVASQPCLICGRAPSDAHHLRFSQPRAMGRKTSDEFTVPLCRAHHRDNHRMGNEQKWWKENTSADPVQVALSLWQASRGTSPTEN